MTPNDLGSLAATFGPTAAILLVMYLNRAPTVKESKSDPLAAILAVLSEIKSDLEILKDRNPRK